jgi:hypothetical protein
MRSGITQTNGNERRKDDEDPIKNIDERKPTYQITNDKPENLRRLCNETRINKQNPFSYQKQNFSDKWNSMEEKWIRLCKMRKGTPNEIFRAEFQEMVKGPGQRRKLSRIRGRNRSAINTKKDKRPIISVQRATRSHHRRNTRSYRQRGSEE